MNLMSTQEDFVYDRRRSAGVLGAVKPERVWDREWHGAKAVSKFSDIYSHCSSPPRVLAGKIA